MHEPNKFSASREKLGRARKHIEELKIEAGKYIAADPVTLSWEPTPWVPRLAGTVEPDANVIGLIPRIRVPMPAPLSPMIGDVVHNLRSALDVMMFELISDDPRVKLRSIEFPFRKSENGTATGIKCLRFAPRFAELAEAWQPYPRGKYRLHALHDMWNTDKHRTLIPVLSGLVFSESYALTAHLLQGQKFTDPFPIYKPVIDGQPCIWGRQGDAPLGLPIPCIYRLSFDGYEDIKGREFISELNYQADTVARVLKSFETLDAPNFDPTDPKPAPVRVGSDAWMCPSSMSHDEIDN